MNEMYAGCVLKHFYFNLATSEVEMIEVVPSLYFCCLLDRRLHEECYRVWEIVAERFCLSDR